MSDELWRRAGPVLMALAQSGEFPELPKEFGMQENVQRAELTYVIGALLPEFEERFRAWNAEYAEHQRDLGIRGEFANLWRKARKLKAVLWDGVDDSAWREGARTVLFEIVAHAFLMLFDYDKANEEIGIRTAARESDNPESNWEPEEVAKQDKEFVKAALGEEEITAPTDKERAEFAAARVSCCDGAGTHTYMAGCNYFRGIGLNVDNGSKADAKAS